MILTLNSFSHVLTLRLTRVDDLLNDFAKTNETSGFFSTPTREPPFTQFVAKIFFSSDSSKLRKVGIHFIIESDDFNTPIVNECVEQ